MSNDKDDNFVAVADAADAKPMGKLEKEAVTYEKAYKKLVYVMFLSTIFVIL